MANKKVIIGVSVACGVVLVGLAIFLGIYLTRDTDEGEEQTIIDLTEVTETNVGPIRGLNAATGGYSLFLGIPYAEVDKSNPFGLSSAHPKFTDTFDAVDDSIVCPQIDDIKKNVVGHIDCLHLNVYKPDSASSSNLLPVLVWLNGEGFLNGISKKEVFDPEFLIRHDVIVVSINYRVGAYGFMCLDVSQVPGNQGLKDQLLALKWIKNNIQAFGGNPNKITMLGHGSGAKSIDYHLVSEQEVLFNQAILQSGVAVAPPSVSEADNTLPLQLAAILGLNTNSVADALSHLSTANTDEVVKATSEIRDSMLPCIEKGTDKFLASNPIDSKPRVNNMPIIIGITDNEKTPDFTDESSAFYNNLESLINDKISSNFIMDNSTLARMVDIVRRFYLGDDAISATNKQQIINFDSDFEYVHPNQRRIYDFIDNGASAVYNYVFSYDGRRNFGKFKNDLPATTPGAVHGDELGYLFDISILPGNISPNDDHMIDQLTTMWTNFAKYGNPTPEVTELLPVKWEPVTSSVLHFLNIGRELSQDNRPFRRRLTFWDMFYKLNKDRQVGRS